MKEFGSFSKIKRFDDLSKAVQYCTLCPRLLHRTKVLTNLNGNIDSKVLFIAEAPGRHGADRTGIPLYGDRTGDIFESLIKNIGWDRGHIFLTNAVLCNPQEKNGNNDTPTKEELFNCSPYLEMTIELIQPDVIVPLGKIALDSLALISPHFLTLRDDVGNLAPWNGRYIFPLYHPSPRALLHRSLAKQRSDYMALARLVNPLKGIKITKKIKSQLILIKKNKTTLQEMTLIFVSRLKELSFFKLTKLLYLTDFMALKHIGKTISGEIYLRRQEGPWMPNLSKTLNSLKDNEIKIYYKNRIPSVSIGPNCDLKISLNEKELDVILKTISRYGKMNNSQIKSAAYLTEPMKYVLNQEKSGRNMQKIPVLYKNKTAIEIDKDP